MIQLKMLKATFQNLKVGLFCSNKTNKERANLAYIAVLREIHQDWPFMLQENVSKISFLLDIIYQLPFLV